MSLKAVLLGIYPQEKKNQSVVRSYSITYNGKKSNVCNSDLAK
jgi:hypothetical protein